MGVINRRDFLAQAAAAVGVSLGARSFGAEAVVATRPAEKKLLRATDQVVLGKTGIKTSRLSIGTGTRGGSEQRGAGNDAMVRLFRGALDEGIRWWDAADMYRSHPYLKLTLKEIKRDQVVITSKTWNKTAEGVKADLERFRKELDTDYIDILLLHCMTDDKWPEKMKGPMDVLSEAKQKGLVRAVGCSCHTFGALKAAADEPWVEVDLARINPFAVMMDVEKADEVSKVSEVLETMHQRGKSIYGMKIIGEGALKGDKIDESLKFALEKPYLSGFTIGFSKPEQIADIAKRIEKLGIKA